MKKNDERITDMVDTQTIRCVREWTWIFLQDMPLAYGKGIPNVLTHPNAEPFFFFANNVKKAYEYNCTEKICNCPQHTWNAWRCDDVYLNDFNPYETFGYEWRPPPLKEYYYKTRKVDKPIIVLNNKFNEEWNTSPTNFLSLNFIKEFIKTFKHKYDIYYIRYDNQMKTDGYFDDAETFTFEDYKSPTLLKEVFTIYDYMKENRIGFNQAQLEMMAQAKHIVTVNGGNAVLSSYFGSDVMIYSCLDVLPERGIWMTNSWLRMLSGSNIYGFINEKEMLEECKKKWL